jgi:hypothetical protein
MTYKEGILNINLVSKESSSVKKRRTKKRDFLNVKGIRLILDSMFPNTPVDWTFPFAI